LLDAAGSAVSRGARQGAIRIATTMIGTVQQLPQRRPPARRTCACVCALALSACVAFSARADTIALSPGQTRDDQLAAGQHGDYRVALGAGEAAELSVQQHDALLHLRWKTDAGAQSPLLLTQAGREAKLIVHLVADAATTWTLDLAAAKADKTATFTISLGPAHAITRSDREIEAAEHSLAAAETIRLAAGGVEPGKKLDADLGAARARYDEAIRHARAASAPCGVLTAAVGRARLELAQARYPESQAAAQTALDAGCVDATDLAIAADRAAALRTLAAAKGYQGDFEASAAASEEALALYRRTGDLRFQGVLLGNLSAVYRSLGETGKALEAARAALAIAEATGDAQGVAFSRENIANSHLARGDLALALETYRKTLDDLRTTPYPMTEGMVWNELGALYRRLGEPDDARAAWAQSRAIWETTGNRSGMAETWINEGEAALDDDAVAMAAAAFERALEIARADRLQSPELNALRGLGRTATRTSNYDDAQRHLDASLNRARAIRETAAEIAAEQALGDLESRRGRADAARQHYAKALALAQKSVDIGAQAAAQASLARLALQAGEPERAREEIERALAIVETQRAAIADPDLRTGYFASQRAYYGLLIDVLMDLDTRQPGKGYAALALEASERARARSLLDLLSERSIDIERDVDPQLLAAERAAEDRLRTLAYRMARLASDADRSERARIQREIDQATRDLDAARGRLRAANPRYAELALPLPLRVKDIQSELLDADASVLEYWLGERRSYLWLITRDALHAVVLPPRAAIDDAASVLRQNIVAPATRTAVISMEERASLDAVQAQALRKTSDALEELVVPPAVRPLLRANVVVVADGELQAIPFSVFDATVESAPNSLTAAAYTYLPSLGALRGLRALPRADAKTRALAILADPVFDADDARLRGVTNAAAPGDAVLQSAAAEAGVAGMPRLAYTRTEAQAIRAMAPRQDAWLALDFDANRKAALDANWRAYSIVHFATHALLNARHPELSGIVLSLYDAEGYAEDGFLRMNDIYNLRLRADLVVLSVCDSAVGKSVGAEGASHLARAFFHAGARRVVASLWPVDDRAGVEFMRAFYRALLERDLPPQVALREAQAELRRNPRWRAPYYWSGFVLQGDWQ
jgi:CHAT domain-containing protein